MRKDIPTSAQRIEDFEAWCEDVAGGSFNQAGRKLHCNFWTETEVDDGYPEPDSQRAGSSVTYNLATEDIVVRDMHNLLSTDPSTHRHEVDSLSSVELEKPDLVVNIPSSLDEGDTVDVEYTTEATSERKRETLENVKVKGVTGGIVILENPFEEEGRLNELPDTNLDLIVDPARDLIVSDENDNEGYFGSDVMMKNS